MKIGRYRFYCMLKNEVLLPAFKGSVFRGALGSCFRSSVCVLRREQCPSCFLKGRCLYVKIFEAWLLTPSEPAPQPTPPLPYVIEPPLEKGTRMNQGESFDFSLVLFGETNDYLPYFIFALEKMGETGIGRRIGGKRGGFAVEKVTAGEQIIYEGGGGKILNSFHAPDIELDSPPALSGNGRGNLILTLETPLRLKFRNSLQAELPFDILARGMLRRVSSLFSIFGGGEPPLDYPGMVRDAASVTTTAAALRWFDWERYSARQEQKMLLGGMLGSVTYQGEIGPYLPLLEFCRLAHLGKQATFGLGKIDFRWEPA